MTILKIHGCSGAGKTTAARVLFSHASVVRSAGSGGGRTTVNRLDIPDVKLPVYVLGDYSANCGGVDSIDSAAEVMRLIEKFYPHGHIVFEGLLQSTYYGKMGEQSKHYGDDYVYCFLDTPLQVCLDRVAERRAKNKTTSKFDPTITQEKYYNVWRLHHKLQDTTHHRVEVLEYDKPMLPQLLRLFV